MRFEIPGSSRLRWEGPEVRALLGNLLLSHIAKEQTKEQEEVTSHVRRGNTEDEMEAEPLH